MKKLMTISLIALLILSGLSGCLDNKSDNKGNETRPTVNSENTDTDVKSDVNENIGTNIENIDINSKGTDISTTNEGSGWCTPGDKVTVNNEEFTVIGITTYTTKDGDVHDGVCKAEKAIEGGNSVRYYNQDMSFIAAESKSSGKNAHAEAFVEVNK